MNDQAEGATTLHDDLSAAFDEVTTAAESSPAMQQPATEPEPAVTPESQAIGTTARDGKGKFASNSAKDPAKPETAKPVTSTGREAAAPGASQPATGAAAPATLKAPQSWRPAAREKWSALPKEAQEEVLKRDHETQAALHESAEARKLQADFNRVVSPYEAFIRSAGSEPLKTVQNMLNTAVMLRTAPPQVKAKEAAALIRQYNIPVDMIAAFLDGQPVQQGHAAQQAAFRDPRLDELISVIEQDQKTRSEGIISQAMEETKAFAGDHEYFEDVREDMADIMEVSAKRKIVLTREQAYDRACAMHPEISGILAQRKAAEQAATSQGATQRAKQAASSVRSHPTVSAGGRAESGDLRSTIEAAMEEVASR